jgi:hypothetical protein
MYGMRCLRRVRQRRRGERGGMTRDPIWLLLLAASLIGVAACALLGGTTKAPIVNQCDDGSTCPAGYACPPLADPGGRCQADNGIVEQGDVRAVDAGR